MTGTISIDTTSQRFSSGPQPTPDIDCLHTTEGMSWPGYANGGEAPHATIRPLPGIGIAVREHIPFTQYAKALVNAPGGVLTNTSGVVQFELMGSCDPKRRGQPGWYFWPEADDAVLSALAAYVKPIHTRFGIRNASSVPWLGYPDSYGSKNGQRLSFADWNAYKGILGHQHVPENDHGDPGAFPIDRFLTFLGEASSPVIVKPVPKPQPKPAPVAPRFPLPVGYYFGPASGGRQSISGYYNRLPSGRIGHPGLLAWQGQMQYRGWRIVPDGLYGDVTAKVALQFGAEKRVAGGRDDLIGPLMWSAAWTADIT